MPVHACPAAQATQAPLPSQTMPAPQPVPGDRLPKSRQTSAPVAQLVMPVLQGVGFVVQLALAVQATQVPALLQTMFMPQPVPPGLLLSSAQVWTPVEHDVVPFLQGPGFVEHDCPAAHATQVALPLQTMPTPQLVPGARSAPFPQVVMLPQVVVPCLHTFELPVQL